MSNTKKATISLTPEQQEKARFLSKELFGKENISGLVGFLIERWKKEQKTSLLQSKQGFFVLFCGRVKIFLINSL